MLDVYRFGPYWLLPKLPLLQLNKAFGAKDRPSTKSASVPADPPRSVTKQIVKLTKLAVERLIIKWHSLADFKFGILEARALQSSWDCEPAAIAMNQRADRAQAQVDRKNWSWHT